MTLIDNLEATNDVALAVTSALEQVLGVDVILAVGVAQRQAPNADLLPEGASRAVSLPDHRRRRRRDRTDRQRAARGHARGARRRRAAHVEHVGRAGSRRRPRWRPGRHRAQPRARDEVPIDAVTVDDADFIVYPLAAERRARRVPRDQGRHRGGADIGRAPRVRAARTTVAPISRAAARSRS